MFSVSTSLPVFIFKYFQLLLISILSLSLFHLLWCETWFLLCCDELNDNCVQCPDHWWDGGVESDDVNVTQARSWRERETPVRMGSPHP